MKPTKIKDLISSDFPKLTIKSFKLIDHGWDHVVAEVNRAYMFRFPRNKKVQFESEMKALDLLRGRITLAIPQIEFVGKAASYMGYHKIPGTRFTNRLLGSLTARERARLVRDLANFLFEIHSAMSVSEAKRIDLRDELPRPFHDRIPIIIKKHIENKKIIQFLNETVTAFRKLGHTHDRLVFLYNDLHNDNMAWNTKTKRLNGIFDFGDVAVGDIHLDFHPLYKFNQHLMEEVVRAYERRATTKLSLPRIIIYARMNELADLAEYIDQPTSRVYKKAMKRIRMWQDEKIINED